MTMFGYLLCALIAIVPLATGVGIIWFLRGKVRLLAGTALLAVFAAVVLFALSPLPHSLGLTRDPGYDGGSLVPVVMVGAEFAAVLAVLGMIIAAVGRSVARQRKQPAKSQ